MILAIQCNKCGTWRVAETNDVPNYSFKCFQSNCIRSKNPIKLRAYGYYQCETKKQPSLKEAELFVKEKNKVGL